MNSGTPVRGTERRKSKTCTFKNYGTPVRRTRRRKYQQKITFRNDGTPTRRTKYRKFQNCTFKNVGTPARRTRRRKFQEKCTFRNYGTPVRRAKLRKSRKLHVQEFWDFCPQNNTSEISTNALSEIMGLLYVEHNVGNLKRCTYKI